MIIIAHELVNRGHQVDLVVANRDGPFCGQVPTTVRVVDLGNTWQRLPGLRNRRGLWVPLSMRTLADYLRTEWPDVVLATSHPANLTALWARRRSKTRIPIVLSANMHLTAATARQGMTGRLLRDLVRRCYPAADGVIAISQGVAEDLVRATDLPRERIATIYNPLDIAAVQRQAKRPCEPRWPGADPVPIVLGVGKLKAQKDFVTLIRAFARVRARRQVRLVILGEGEHRAALLALARTLGVGADVALPGFVANPYAWMARAAVFVLSSAWEGFSNALLEVFACGCPVVSTDCPSGPREILADGAFGALVPVGDERALAAAIERTLVAPPEAARLRARAATFSVERAVEGYLEVLRRACGASVRAPLPEPAEASFG